MDRQIVTLDQAVKKAAEQNEKARLLMTQPGVGPVTSLAYVLTMGDVTRFQHGKQVASYLGLMPREYSSAGKQRLGGITKQGNRFMRMLLVESAQVAVRYDSGFRSEYPLLDAAKEAAICAKKGVGLPGCVVRDRKSERVLHPRTISAVFDRCFGHKNP